MQPFTRNLGSQSGVELGYQRSENEGFPQNNSTESFATMGLTSRGRTDKAFKINASNWKRYVGRGKALSIKPTDEVYLHLYEAFQNGASECIFSRTDREDSVLKYITVNNGTAGTAKAYVNTAGTVVITYASHNYNVGDVVAISSATLTGLNGQQVVTAKDSGTITFVSGSASGSGTLNIAVENLALSTSSTPPASAFFNIEHKEKFNDGIIAEITFLPKYTPNTTTEIASDLIKVRLLEVGTEKQLYSFTGSLDEDAVDDFGNSTYIKDVVDGLTDNVVLHFGATPTTSVDPSFGLYNTIISEEFSSATDPYFVEGTTTPDSDLIDESVARLRYNEFDFRYVISAGTQSATEIVALATFAKETNRTIMIDIDADIDTWEAAILQVNTIGSSIMGSYHHWYWTPLKAKDPLNGGKAVWGSSGAQVGYRCTRNAKTDNNGIPAINRVIAGKAYPINRQNITQLSFPDDDNGGLSDLADARINPVIFEKYTISSAYIFKDSLTGLREENPLKLVNISEMAAQNDDWIAKKGKECLQIPMEDCLLQMSNFLRSLFEAEETAKWIIPSVELKGRTYTFSLKRNQARPNDAIDIEYGLHYDGTARALFVQQTVSR